MSDNTSITTDSDISDNLYSVLELYVHSQTPVSFCSTDEYDCGATILENCSSDVCFGMVPITDSFGDDILEENGRISLAYENLQLIPNRLAEKFATKTKCLDLSYNNFQNLSFLTFFNKLHTLILDRNTSLDVNTVPFLPKLEILWINNCEISNLADWLYRVQDLCPKLQQLSMMGNPGEIILLKGRSDIDYREHVFGILSNLRHLNGVARKPCAKVSQSAIATVRNHGGNRIQKKLK